MMNDRYIRLEGVVTALTPIVHMSGESHKVDQSVVDENIKWVVVRKDNGETEKIPVLNGSGKRGIYRDHGAEIISKKIKGHRNLHDFRLLFSGGGPKTAKISKDNKNVVDLEKERTFRQASPFLLLFGGQLWSPIPGHLRVGALVPICEDTKHLMPDYYSSGITFLKEVPNSQAMFTRRQDDDNPEYAIYLLKEAWEEKLAEKKASEKRGAVKAKKNKEKDANLSEEEKALSVEKDYNIKMIRNFEVIPAGTRMYHWIDIFNASDEEIGLLVAILKRFANAPYVGGRSSNGYGRISADYALIVDGDIANREEHAIVMNPNDIFDINSQLLNSCLVSFESWLNALTPEKSAYFGTM